jgi:hypothetical protein
LAGLAAANVLVPAACAAGPASDTLSSNEIKLSNAVLKPTLVIAFIENYSLAASSDSLPGAHLLEYELHSNEQSSEFLSKFAHIDGPPNE